MFTFQMKYRDPKYTTVPVTYWIKKFGLSNKNNLTRGVTLNIICSEIKQINSSFSLYYKAGVTYSYLTIKKN